MLPPAPSCALSARSRGARRGPPRPRHASHLARPRGREVRNSIARAAMPPRSRRSANQSGASLSESARKLPCLGHLAWAGQERVEIAPPSRRVVPLTMTGDRAQLKTFSMRPRSRAAVSVLSSQMGSSVRWMAATADAAHQHVADRGFGVGVQSCRHRRGSSHSELLLLTVRYLSTASEKVSPRRCGPLPRWPARAIPAPPPGQRLAE
jgi:hypothetical protein